MSVALTLAMTSTVVETLSDASLATADKTVTHNVYNVAKSLTSSTTPPVTKVAAGPVTLIAGAKTLDLTAITGTNGATVDLTGLKVQSILFTANAANANTMSIAVGASNGYDLAGSDFKATLQPGQSIMLFGNDATPDVASGEKTLDFAGTLVQGGTIVIVAG